MDVAAVLGSDESVAPLIEQLATPEVAAQLTVAFPGNIPRQVTSFAVGEVVDETSVEIHDCMILDQPISTSNSVWFSGRATTSESGTWVVDEVTIVSLVGCVPAPMAAAALEGYDSYWEARTTYFDPPDPDSPLIEQTTIGGHRESTTALAMRLERDGQALRGVTERHPEFAAVRSPTDITIVDCQEMDQGRGVFVIETGERTDLVEPIVEGQRDGVQTILQLEDGVWKVADVQGQSNFDCEFAPTSVGIPVVPQES